MKRTGVVLLIAGAVILLVVGAAGAVFYVNGHAFMHGLHLIGANVLWSQG